MSTLDLVEEDALRRPAQARLLSLAEGAATGNCLLLERRRSAIKDQDGVDVQEQELAQPAEEAKDRRVLHHVAGLVPHSLDELDEPDGRIDRELLPGELLE